jgi:hypothetical protein
MTHRRHLHYSSRHDRSNDVNSIISECFFHELAALGPYHAMEEQCHKHFNVFIVVVVWVFILLSSAKYSFSTESGWAKWGQWTRDCPRRCDQENGYQSRSRHCMLCIMGSCVKMEKPCVGRGDQKEVRMCYEPKCTGEGEYVGSWGPWSISSQCKLPMKGPPCEDYQKTRTGKMRYVRRCNGPTQERRGGYKCSDPTGKSAVNQRNCTLPCPGRNGRWGAWGSWSRCSVTCGKGSYTRRRKCINPAPIGNGKPCAGDSVGKSECIRDIRCPIDGGWSEWSEWVCTVTCGEGTGKSPFYRKHLGYMIGLAYQKPAGNLIQNYKF